MTVTANPATSIAPFRVLVCDDDAAVHVMLGVALDHVELVEASRHVEAESAVMICPLDAAVIDRRLPDGDGLDLVRALRKLPPSVELPIVVLTAGHRPEDVEEVLASGADEYVSKPIEPADLAELLQRLTLLTGDERKTRRTLKRARARAGRHDGGWDDLPELPHAAAKPRKRRFRI